MRVLVISGAFPPMNAGEADHVAHLCSHLAKRGLDVHVLTSVQASNGNSWPFQVHRQLSGWSWGCAPALVRSVRAIAPDVVLLIYTDWVYERHLMVTFTPILTRLFSSRTRFVTQLETGETSLQASLVTRAILKMLRIVRGHHESRNLHMGLLLHGSDSLIMLSEKHKARHLEYFSQLDRRALVIPPPPIIHMWNDPEGIGRSGLRKRLGMAADEFVIVYFGYVNPAKGVDTLFEAMGILKTRGRRVRLVVLGGGVDLAQPTPDIHSLLARSAELDIDDRITWTGRYEADSDEASRYLFAADACVLPFRSGVTMSRSSFAAAVAHGLPVVTTRGDVLECPLVDGENVYLCPPQDPEAIASAIGTLMTDSALGQRLRSGALRLAREHFSWERAVDRTIAALSGVAGPSEYVTSRQ